MDNDLISRKALKAEVKAWSHDALDLRTISQIIDSAPAAEIVSRDEYEALLKRFRHLLESEYIASFDRVNRRTGVYVRDIREADTNTIVRCKECRYFMEYQRPFARVANADGDCRCKMFDDAYHLLCLPVHYDDYCSKAVKRGESE